ncbi:MAG: hypothetical protein ACFFFB_12930 [Candidatus Heimdallarchaeota archaeon]
MSKEQPLSSKKSKSDKSGVKKRVRDYVSKQNDKLSRTSSKVKSQLSSFYSEKIIHQEVYVDGQEPESYSFKRKFYALYGIFIVYSLVLIAGINIPGTWVNFLTFGDPFAFSNTIIAFFLVLSFLFSIDKLRVFIFEKKTALKQLILYCSLIAGLYILFLYISTDLNFTTYLLALGMIWLILLSSRFYIYSRKFSTKIEARFVKKYSIPRYLVAIIIPFFILGILVTISLLYRSLLVFLSLEFFGNIDPSSAVDVYNLEMRIIMPLIYFSLVLTLVFIIFEFVFTRRRAETKRAGTFDNFTFSLIVLFIFFFQILQISIYMFLRPETVTALKATIGAAGSPTSYIFIFEFIISMYFLFRIVRKTGRTLGWRILFFKKDGLIMLFLACVFAQTLARFILANEIPNQVISDVGVWLMADKYIISVLVIFFLGSTILIYYLKPHETSMFMRLQKETVSKEEKNFEKIYKIIRSEYIRRGEAYPIKIVERELIKATQLSKGNMYSLLEQLVDKDMDIIIREEKEKFAKPTKMIDFVSVTERFEKKDIAKQKAKRYLSERLLETALEKDRKTSRLKISDNSGKATDSFISSLTKDFSKKQRDKEIFAQKLKEKEVSFTPGKLAGNLKNQVIQIIKKEYIYRLENPEKIPDFYVPISEISNEIEMATKITPGELYLLLDEMNKEDIEFLLMTNPEEPEDKKIKFLPYADDNMNYSLAHFRPEEYSKFRILVMKNFLKNLKTKKEKRILFQLKKEIPDLTEAQNSWIYLLTTLYKYYPLYIESLERVPNKMELLKQLDLIKKAFVEKHALVGET